MRTKVDFALISDKRMRNLNKQFLGKNETTDVLAFPMKEKLPEGVYLLGEIVVNRDAARRQARRFGGQAKEYGVLEKEELARLITHGALHLLGFKDKTSVDRKKMKLTEDRVLAELNV